MALSSFVDDLASARIPFILLFDFYPGTIGAMHLMLQLYLHGIDPDQLCLLQGYEKFDDQFLPRLKLT